MDEAVGAPTSEVLYVFDEANPIDPLSLASLIQVRSEGRLRRSVLHADP